MSNWFYHQAGRQIGPVTEQDLKNLLQSRTLAPGTLVWTEGMQQWQEAATIHNLIPPASPPPPPGSGLRLQTQTPAPPPPPQSVAATAQTHALGACPLCGLEKHMNKGKPLYGHKVCKSCYYKFANRRQAAFFVDIMIWRFIMTPVGMVLGTALALLGMSQAGIQGVASLLGLLLLPVFYCKDCFSGYSPGKKLCGVRTVDTTTGAPAGIIASFKRNLPLLIPFMPIIVAGRLCKGHRTGDGWSNTKVIWQKYATSSVFAPKQPAP